MERYANLSGKSGVAGFEITADSITVVFRDGSRYLYTVASAGRPNISTMHTLAQAGSGLNSFINKYVKMLYVK